MARRLDDWIKFYCDTFAHGEAPEKFNFWVAVSTIAGALRRRVSINEGTFKWFPNFFIVLVGEPGVVKKGTAMKTGIRLLREVPGVALGSDVATWQGFLKQLENSLDSFPIGQVNGHLLTQRHITTCALTICITEWGTFINPRDDQLISMLTKLWDCEDDISLSKTTSTQGDITIVNPFVNMLAATTPGWLRDNIKIQFGGWGISSRIIFVFSNRPAHVVPYPSRQIQASKGLNERLALLTTELRAVAQLRGEYRLTDDAFAYGDFWYRQHSDRRMNIAAQKDASSWLKDFLSRKFDQAHKLAMVLAASRRDALVIEQADLADALTRMDEVETEMLSIFGQKDTAPAVSAAARINNHAWQHLSAGLASNPLMPKPHLHRFLARYMDYRAANNFLEQLVAMHWLQQEQHPDGLYVTLGPEAPQENRQWQS